MRPVVISEADPPGGLYGGWSPSPGAEELNALGPPSQLVPGSPGDPAGFCSTHLTAEKGSPSSGLQDPESCSSGCWGSQEVSSEPIDFTPPLPFFHV